MGRFCFIFAECKYCIHKGCLKLYEEERDEERRAKAAKVAAAAPAGTGNALDDLKAQGYGEDECIEALASTGGDIVAAAEWLKGRRPAAGASALKTSSSTLVRVSDMSKSADIRESLRASDATLLCADDGYGDDDVGQDEWFLHECVESPAKAFEVLSIRDTFSLLLSVCAPPHFATLFFF